MINEMLGMHCVAPIKNYPSGSTAIRDIAFLKSGTTSRWSKLQQ